MPGIVKRTRRAVNRVAAAGRQALIDVTPHWAREPLTPFAAYLDMLFVDHGIFRVLYLNRHRLSEKAWRAAQPAPHQIASLKAAGVRTVVNLRGAFTTGSYWLEKRACEHHGIALVNFNVRSRAAPSRTELHGARELFHRVEYPILMHCKSGADRAGLMSVLYLHVHEGLPVEIAKKALSLRYGHIRQADTGILDYFFERYLADNAREPIAFYDWVDTVYDPDELHRTFKAQGWANRLVNSILRRE
ncbi:MAG: tyrosine-protein phosphatase [Hyphomicrobiaceae bacterium]